MRKMKDSGIEWIGKIPEGWEVCKLKYLATVQTGNTPSMNNENLFFSREKGIPWIKAENLNTDMSIEKTEQYLTPEGVNEGRLFPKNTIYICCIASIGKVGFSCIEASCNQQINALSFNDKFYWKYGFYLSKAQEEEYLLLASGNVVKILNSERQKNMFCPFPPLYEQQQIADFLDKKCSEIDSVISKTRKTIEEYKKLKQSIITEVVTGKIKIENEKVCGKYDIYKDSGIEWIGEIPSEWEVKRLKFSSKVRNEKYSESYGVLEYFGLENIESHSAKFIETENIYDITQSQICRKDDIVFGKLRPYLAKIFEVPIDECCSSEFAVFYNFEGYNKFFKYLFLSYWFITIVDASTYGTKMPRANIDFIKNMIIPLPDFKTQQQIADFLDNKCSEIDSLIAKKEQLVVELESYKKSLIYEVVTGKRSV